MLKQFLHRWSWVWFSAIFAAAISNESFWIDEALTGTKAREATLGDWWRRMAGEKMSDLQMPLYMGSIWGYAKVFGTGEWTLRMMNLPWMVVGAVAFVRSFSQSRQMMAAGALLCLSPFVWYYLNEARPYAMQLGAALLSLAALQALAANRTLENRRSESWWFGLFCAGLVVLGGSQMLGMIWVVAAVVALGIVRPWADAINLLRRKPGMTAGTVGCLLLLGCYYFWTLKVGARASATAGTNWMTVAFAGYELAGFNGLGPGRLQLRESGVAALRSYWGWLLAYALLWGLIILTAFPKLNSCSRRSLALTSCVLGPVLFLVAAGFFAHFRLLGRHLTPLAAVMIWGLTLCVARLWADRVLWKRVGVLGFVGLSLVSCLSLRFASRHARDDYRAASTRSRTTLQQGGIVWWSAAQHGAKYYGVPLEPPPGKNGRAVELINSTTAKIQDLPPPEMVVLSKPDVHDVTGALVAYLAQHGYQLAESLPGFTIWVRPGRPEADR